MNVSACDHSAGKAASNLQPTSNSVATTNSSTVETVIYEGTLSSTSSTAKGQDDQVQGWDRIHKFLIEQHALDHEEKIVFQEETDLDGDGNKEVVVATGNKDSVAVVYVIRDKGDHYENLSGGNGIRNNNGYYTDNLKLVKLKNTKKTYLSIGQTNGMMHGFHLYELRDNNMEYVGGRANPTGSGDVYLADIDGDGIYEGYIDSQYSYDVNFIPVKSLYSFNGKGFELQSVDVTLPQLPTAPKEIVDQYIKLSFLHIEEPKALYTINQRLDQLSQGYRIKVSEQEEDGLRQFITIGQIDQMKERVEDDSHMVIPIKYNDPSVKISMEFSLELQEGRWIIRSARNLSGLK